MKFDIYCDESRPDLFTSKSAIGDKYLLIGGLRIDWIKSTLQDPTADLRIGWDTASKSYVKSRRVALVQGNYVVIVRLRKTKSGHIAVLLSIAK